MWDRLREIHTRPSVERLFNTWISIISYTGLEGLSIEQRAARPKRLNHEMAQMVPSMRLGDPQLVGLLIKGLLREYDTRIKIMVTTGG